MVTWKNVFNSTLLYSFKHKQELADSHGYPFFVYKGNVYSTDDGRSANVSVKDLDNQREEDCKEFFRIGYQACHPANKEIVLNEGLLNIFRSSYTNYAGNIKPGN